MNTSRNMIFISHAWQDYEVTKWIALKLASEGYGVWCDITKLLGGENWPNEINQALQNRTCLFLFLLSKNSNGRPDPMGEFETARKVMKRENIEHFIVPLKVDDISRDEVDYRLQEIQTISFDKSWADGLAELLRLLDERDIPKHPSFNPQAVNEWWRGRWVNALSIKETSEELLSNRFEVIRYPQYINVHVFDGKPKISGYIKYPIVAYKNHILSYANADDLNEESGMLSRIIETVPILTDDLLCGDDILFQNTEYGIHYFKIIMNQSFGKGVINKGLKKYELSKYNCFYFNEDILSDGRIIHLNGGSLNPRIKLWGRHLKDRWYFAIRGKIVLEPILHYVIYIHILISTESGLKPASKSVYKRWFNNTYKNRLVAAIIHLAEGDEIVNFKVGREQMLALRKTPVVFNSPVSYDEAEVVSENEEIETDELTD